MPKVAHQIANRIIREAASEGKSAFHAADLRQEVT